MDKAELIKQAYAYGCSVALKEAGYQQEIVEDTAVKLAQAPEVSQEVLVALNNVFNPAR